MKYVSTMILLVTTILMTACASQRHLPEHDQPLPVASTRNSLQIQYLGVGGHRLQYGENVLLTAPSFTNPHFLRVGPFMPIHSDHDRVDRYMPDAGNAQMLLVGHAHYDHLMDVAYILQAHAPKAHLYGSRTTVHSLASAIPASRMTAMNDSMGTPDTPGQWFYSANRGIRIMALKSSHAPHFMGIKFMQGRYEQPQDALPWHAFGWKEGQTLAFLIDFLDEQQQPVYRVFYQDSASEEAQGVVPDLADGKAIDVAILCPASFSQVDHYPESIVRNTAASHFILGHWEDFFANDPYGQQRFVRNTDQDEFIRRLTQALPAGSHWTLPNLFSTYYFGPEGAIQP